MLVKLKNIQSYAPFLADRWTHKPTQTNIQRDGQKDELIDNLKVRHMDREMCVQTEHRDQFELVRGKSG